MPRLLQRAQPACRDSKLLTSLVPRLCSAIVTESHDLRRAAVDRAADRAAFGAGHVVALLLGQGVSVASQGEAHNPASLAGSAESMMGCLAQHTTALCRRRRRRHHLARRTQIRPLCIEPPPPVAGEDVKLCMPR